MGGHEGTDVTALLRGFADPVRESQAVFRAVMNAMARPGRIHVVAGPAEVPAPLGRATAAVLLTLVDGETRLWLDAGAAAAWDWASFHCGASRCEADRAQFAVVLEWTGISQFATGSDEEPERSTTVILQVAGLGSGEALRLSGPGLAGEETLLVTGMPEDFREEWAVNRQMFPRGVDVILCAGDELAALPRTVEII